MFWLILIIVIIFIITLFWLDRPRVYPLALYFTDMTYYLVDNKNILSRTIIKDVSKHCTDPYKPTKNELILYQLQANLNEQETEAFEKVFVKILKS